MCRIWPTNAKLCAVSDSYGGIYGGLKTSMHHKQRSLRSLGQLHSLSCHASEFLQHKQLVGPVSTPLVWRTSLCSNTGTDTHFHPEYVEATAAANIHWPYHVPAPPQPLMYAEERDPQEVTPGWILTGVEQPHRSLGGMRTPCCS